MELRTTRLKNHNMKEYLAKIKAPVDSLASIGDPVSSRDHLDAILDGLPQEYDPISGESEKEREIYGEHNGDPLY